ncbi:MAG: DUF86 domain-containing protein [Oscillospiraceae bacterium]|jgi:uncharacterized protein with HEPN domain|nr:DUF86 domain-containing protein [Oscillospiraceae bacterium]
MRRDLHLLEHIADYCDDIQDTLISVESSFERFTSDKQAQYAVAFSILQIGELVNRLSDELRSGTKDEIEWSAIKGMRNIIAHDYGVIRLNIIWNIASEDIPVLKSFCEAYLETALHDAP